MTEKFKHFIFNYSVKLVLGAIFFKLILFLGLKTNNIESIAQNNQFELGVLLISYQFLWILILQDSLKLFGFKKQQRIKLFFFFSVIIVVAIFLTYCLFPHALNYFYSYSINDLTINNSTFKYSLFFQIELIIWILLTTFTLIFHLKKSGFFNNKAIYKNSPLIIGMVALISGLSTANDVLSQLIITILIVICFVSGFIFVKKANLLDSQNQFYFKIIVVFIVLSLCLLLILTNHTCSIVELIFTVSLMILFQNLKIFINTWRKNKISAILILILPFYLSYYLFKRYNKIMFYKVYSIFLAVVTCLYLLSTYYSYVK